MNKSIFRKMFAKCLLPVVVLCMIPGLQSCLDEYAPGQYYTFTGSTVADFLREDPEGRFSNFLYTLEKAEILGELDTYGSYTCFAPIDEGFADYFNAKGVTSVEQLSKAQCETIAFTHVLNQLVYCSNLSSGAPLSTPNMLGRYMIYNASSRWDEEAQINVPVYNLNGAEIISADDSVSNGVVHVVGKALNPSNKTLPSVMEEDTTISLFCEALKLTGLDDSLQLYKDETYKISTDSTFASGHDFSVSAQTDFWLFPRERYFKFTAFVEQNSVFREKSGGKIVDIASLAKYAQDIYDKDSLFYKEGMLDDDDLLNGYYNYDKESFKSIEKTGKEIREKINDGYKNKNNPLNKFIAYHLLPMELFYTTFNMYGRGKSYDNYELGFIHRDELDVEDFYAPMLAHSVMRISTPLGGGKYINRKGAKNGPDGIVCEGIEIRNMAKETALSNGDYLTMNGTYHYINDILTYDKDTREQTLNCRMRFMASTLSPDYVNSGARGRLRAVDTQKTPTTEEREVYGFKMGYCKNVWRTEQTKAWLRYIDPEFDCTRGDELNLGGPFDIAFRLLPVPTDGIYEIRLHSFSDEGNVGVLVQESDRGIIQVYLAQEDEYGNVSNDSYEACGLPWDLAITAADPRIGNVADADLKEEGMTDEEWEEAIQALDKAMHNRGYMKGVDSYQPRYNSGGNPLRDNTSNMRMILATTQLKANSYYWLRIRLADISKGTDKWSAFGCLEIVPKSVYADPKRNEDRH